MIKLKDYLKEHREEMRIINSYFLFCNITATDEMTLDCSVDFEGENEDSIDFKILVRTIDFEDNKQLISECINGIIEQLKIKNYSYLEIKNSDKWNSISINKYVNLKKSNVNFGGIKLLRVIGEGGEYYNCNDKL